MKVYGAPWCPDCTRTKKFLGEQRISYEWIDVDADPEGLAITIPVSKPLSGKSTARRANNTAARTLRGLGD